MNKLIVVIMGQDCLKFIKMSYQSVKEADKVIFCDGGSSDGTIEYLKEQGFEWEPTDRESSNRLIYQTFDKLDKKMNGKQRNFYLDYLKKRFPDDWCLCIDADEVVEDINKIKEFIQEVPSGLYSVKMRHLIQDLSHEDNTVPVHFVLNRLFKISEAGVYPEVEHPVLMPPVQFVAEGAEIPQTIMGRTDCTIIWHLAYIPNLWEIKKRYEGHLLKSNMHTPEFLKWWYYAHIFGEYPTKKFNPVELPSIILNEFGIDKDELYFQNRNIETKHFIDAIQWRDFFKCKTATEFGCGKGPRVFAMNQIGIEANGLEISQFAVNHKMHNSIIQSDVTKSFSINPVDLVIAYDLLEHIHYNMLDSTIHNLIKSSKEYILISVPVIGDPNLEADPTHIIKETKEWWIKQFTDKGLELIETPNHFLYKEQLMIFKTKYLYTSHA